MSFLLVVVRVPATAQACCRWRCSCPRPRQPRSRDTGMDPMPPLVIHEVLPTEILMVIFEEHAKLEWRAPAIDGKVCRCWRDIVLNTPRAWSCLEISHKRPPTIPNLLLWLDRSCTAPLHIRVGRNFALNEHKTLFNLLFDYHMRIASLRMRMGSLILFDGRDFPSLRFLDIKDWNVRQPFAAPFRWGAMPTIQSLRLGRTSYIVPLLDSVAPLTTLILNKNERIPLSRHSMSLVTLMLFRVSFGDAISASVDFPSLTYLSLYNVSGLKPYINAPRLVTYHESRRPVRESFSVPVPSLVEYGVWDLPHGCADPSEWHRAFPNIIRLSIRARPHVLISLFESLSGQPHSLPALQIISAGPTRTSDATSIEEDRKTMESHVRARSEACHLDVTFHFKVGRPFHIPLFFASVGYSYQIICDILTCILEPKASSVKDRLVWSPYLFA